MIVFSCTVVYMGIQFQIWIRNDCIFMYSCLHGDSVPDLDRNDCIFMYCCLHGDSVPDLDPE